MTRPTRKAVNLFALSLPAGLLVVLFLPDYWYAVFYVPALCLALMAADFVMSLPSKRLQADVRLPVRLYPGEAGRALATLSAPEGRQTRIESLLELEGDTDAPRLHSGSLFAGKSQISLTIFPRRRGKIKVRALWLRWRGPIGLMERARRQPLNLELDVVPDVKGIHETALQFFARDAIHGTKTQRMRGEGTEFDNLCEYAQGMDTRHIDWKRSARHRRLLCKEFRQERNHQIVLGFDTGHLMLEPVDGTPKLDHAIKAGLLLSWISLHSGDLVGGCGFDARMRQFIRPGRGMPWFTQMQRFSSTLAYNTVETNFTLGLAELNARLQRRALIVLFTEFVDSIAAELLLESLNLLTRKHVVVFVSQRDPMLFALQNAEPENFDHVAESVIAHNFVRERAVVLERIHRLGVHCLDVPVNAMSSSVLNRYLMIKQRGLL